MSKILAEWTKVEQIQQEKIKLAMRLEQITSRARERGRSEWKKVGGMDLDEIEKSEGPRNGFGEMGGAEVLLPPGGLGSGSDGRPMKSESTRLRAENGIWDMGAYEQKENRARYLYPSRTIQPLSRTLPLLPCSHRLRLDRAYPLVKQTLDTVAISPRRLCPKTPMRMGRWTPPRQKGRVKRTIRFTVSVNKRVTAR